LIDGVELYTKESISEYYPELKSMINRSGENLDMLELYKEKFILKVDFLYRNRIIKQLKE